jgi:hypothetical protein
MLSAGAQARDELWSLFVTMRDLHAAEDLTQLATRLNEIKPLINAVRLATASVFSEGPDSILKPAQRVEEEIVLFHTAMQVFAARRADANEESAAAYLATCAQQRAAVRTALIDFASAVRGVLDGEPSTPSADEPAVTQAIAEELSWLVDGMGECLGLQPSEIDVDKTIWEHGFSSASVLELVHILRRDHELVVEPIWILEMGDQTLRQIASLIATLRAGGG